MRLHTGYADYDFSTDRTAILGATTQALSSHHDGWEWSAAAELEYALPSSGRWQRRPLAGLRHARLHEEGFTEHGGSAALEVDRRRSSSTELSAGARLLRPLAEGRSTLELRAVLSQLLGDNDVPVSAGLVGETGRFTASGTPLERDALQLSAGITGQLSKRVSGYARLAGEVRGNGQHAYAAGIGLSVRW